LFASARYPADVWFAGHVERTAKIVITCAVGGCVISSEDVMMGFLTESREPEVLDSLPPDLRGSTASYLEALIEHFCAGDDLSSYDPYDIWKTALGFRVKKLFNRRPRLGLFPAAVLALFDDLVNHRLRMFYTRNEYPIVRAMAALGLLNLYRNNGDSRLLKGAERHLQWLLTNSCRDYSKGKPK
jgi:hypothetical protein